MSERGTAPRLQVGVPVGHSFFVLGSVAIKGEARDAPRALPAQKGAPPSKPAIEQAPRPTQQTSGTRSQEEVDTMRRHFLPQLRRRK